MRAVGLLALLGCGLLSAPPASAAEPGSGGLRVVHGLRGLVADVYLDGELVLETFQPERSTDVLNLPAGSHRVQVRTAGSASASKPILEGALDVAEGQVLSAVVHLSADGRPQISQFVEDTTPVPTGQARTVIRHAAAAPEIDVRLDGDTVASDLANGQQGDSQVGAGAHEISVREAGTDQELAPAQSVPLGEGTSTVMYLIGEQEAGTLGWIAVQIAGLQSPPTQVRTGNSGLAASSDDGGLPLPLGAALIGGSVAVALAAAAGRSSRGAQTR